MKTSSLSKSLPGIGALLLAGILSFSAVGCSTPQVLNNEEVFGSLDALWTAVTSRKMDRLQSAGERLEQLHRSGDLSDAGWNAISPIIEQAANGQWEPAARRLKKFIRAQRKV